MAEAILVPQIGQDLSEAKIVELHVKLGDAVKKGDIVAVVESEKASFDVEAFAEGVVIHLPYQEGDTATVLEPLMHLGEPDTEMPGEMPGDMPAGPPTRWDEDAPKAPPTSAASPADAISTGRHAAPVAAVSEVTLRASPVARRTAAGHGLDIAGVAGSGPRGAVVLRDIEAAIGDDTAMTRVAGSGNQGVIELRTLQTGHGSPIVCIHGFGADLSSWRPMVGQLSVGLPIMALDLPGHGSSADLSAIDFASIVETVGQGLRAANDGMHLVGHSLGAAVATALTERGDLDIRSLTLMAPAGLGASVDGAFVEGFLAARSEAALTAWMRRLVYDPASLTSVLVRATLSARENPGLVEAQARLARSVFEGSTLLFSVTEALRRFQGPCTIIAGRDDTIIPYREIEVQVPANVALHRLPRVGHLPQVEAAELVHTLIARTVRAAG